MAQSSLTTNPIRMLICYADEPKESRVATRLLVWFLATIGHVNVETVAAARFTEWAERAIESGFVPSRIFLTALTDGRDRLEPQGWRLLQKLATAASVYAFWKAAKIANSNSVARSLFGCKAAGTFTADVRSVDFRGPLSPLKGTPQLTVETTDQFVAIEGYGSLALAAVGGETFAALHGNSIIWAERAITCGTADGVFEYGRPSYFLSSLDYLLCLGENPCLTFRPRDRWCDIRVDDFPSYWLPELSGERSTFLDNLESILRQCLYRRVHLTLMVVPSILQPSGLLLPIEISASKDHLEIARRYRELGTVSFGLYGVVHGDWNRRLLLTAIAGLWRFRPWSDPLLSKLTREFHDPIFREAPSAAVRESLIKTGLEGVRHSTDEISLVSTPPSYSWDFRTEKSAANQGIRFFSSDNNLLEIGSSHQGRNAPSLIGTTSAGDNRLMHVPVTLYSDPDLDEPSIGPLIRLGIPVIWGRHVRGRDALDIGFVERFASAVLEAWGARAMPISQIGESLQVYRSSHVEALYSGEWRVHSDRADWIVMRWHGRTDDPRLGRSFR